MKLNEQDALPLYKQLVQAVSEGIRKGQYPEGSRLPSEQELSELYGVSRITVRAALKELAADGLVVRRQGKGTYVGRVKLRRDLAMATSFSDACREQGRVPGAKMLYAGYENATEADIRDMQLERARASSASGGCATRTGCPSPSRRTASRSAITSCSTRT